MRFRFYSSLKVIIMEYILNPLLVIVLVLNLAALGSGRVLSLLKTVSVQGAITGALPLILHENPAVSEVLSACAAIILKGFIIPLFMLHTLKATKIRREIEPFIKLQSSVILGSAATCAVLLTARFTGISSGEEVLIITGSFSTVIAGFIILTSRYKAITQVMGYLMLENGIFIFGMLLVDAVPLVVELGVLLDLFAAVFVVSIITNQISRAFSSTDTRDMVSLKEE